MIRTHTFVAIVLLVFAACVFSVPAEAQDYHDFNAHIGGGIGVPLTKTADFAGIGGVFQIGGGPNLSKHSSIVGEFMWQGLPPTPSVLAVINPLITNGNSVSTSTNLYALTANYMYHVSGERYGLYLIGGGGWYYRHTALNNLTVAPGTVCEPAWDWWGFTCQNGLVSTSSTLATKGVSSGGVNGGVGLSINLGKSGFKYFMEARYHYSPQGGRISTQTIPVTFGIRW
jgi:hypothetical protein